MTIRYKLLFPGQGSQSSDMADFLLANDELRVTNIFRSASAILGFDLLELIKKGGEELNQTYNAQPAILTTSYCAYLLLKDKLNFSDSNIIGAVGHSLGEYNALIAAGSLTFAESLQIVRMRGLYMAGDLENNGDFRSKGWTVKNQGGGMMAILTDQATVEAAIAKLDSKEVIEVANINSSAQIVVSGTKKGLGDLEAYMSANHTDIKCVKLNVSAAFHSSLMADAADKFGHYLSKFEIRKPVFPVINNVNANVSDDPRQIKSNLIEHMTHQVKFVKCIETLNELGEGDAIETGHGKILQALVKRIDRNLKVVNFSSFVQ